MKQLRYYGLLLGLVCAMGLSACGRSSDSPVPPRQVIDVGDLFEELPSEANDIILPDGNIELSSSLNLGDGNDRLRIGFNEDGDPSATHLIDIKRENDATNDAAVSDCEGLAHLCGGEEAGDSDTLELSNMLTYGDDLANDGLQATGFEITKISGGPHHFVDSDLGVITGTSEKDTLIISGSLSAVSIDMLAGDDTVTLNADADVTYSGTSQVDCDGTTTRICGGDGTDHLEIKAAGAINGLTTANTLTTSDVFGFEKYTAPAYSLSGFDELTLTDSTLTAITGTSNRDVYAFTNGIYTGTISGAGGNDEITVSGTTLAGAVINKIDPGAGNDEVTLLGKVTLEKSLAMGAGDDTLRLGVNDSGVSSSTNLDITATAAECTAGVHICGDAPTSGTGDTLDLGNALSYSGALTAIGFETTNIRGGSHHFSGSTLGVVTFLGATEFTFSGNNNLRYIMGSSGRDVVTINTGILNFTGSTGITCNGVTNVRLCGGGGTGDTLSIAAGVNIRVNGTALSDIAGLRDITGQWDSCTSATATFNAGTVNAAGSCIEALDVSLANAQDNTAYRDITGTTGDDTDSLTNVTARNVSLLTGNDDLTIIGGTYTGTISGAGGNDIIHVSGVTDIASLDPGAGNDEVTLLGTITLGKSLAMGTGDDLVRLGLTTLRASPTTTLTMTTSTDCTGSAHVCGGGEDTTGDTLEIGGNITLPSGFSAIGFEITRFFGGTHTLDDSTLGAVTFMDGTILNLSGTNELRYIQGSTESDRVNITGGILNFTGAGTNCAGGDGTFRLCGGSGAGDTLTIAGNVTLNIGGNPVNNLAGLTNITRGWETCTEKFAADDVNADGACIIEEIVVGSAFLEVAAAAPDGTEYTGITDPNNTNAGTLTNLTVTGNVNLGTGNDVVTFDRGNYSSAINAGTGDDAITLSGAVTLNTIDGGVGTDHLIVTGSITRSGATTTTLASSYVSNFEQFTAAAYTLSGFTSLTLTDSTLTTITGTTGIDTYTLRGGTMTLTRSLALGTGNDILRLGVDSAGTSTATTLTLTATAAECALNVHICGDGQTGGVGDTLELGNALSYTGNLTVTGFETTKFHGGTHSLSGSTLGTVTFMSGTILNLSGTNNLRSIMGSTSTDRINIADGATLTFAGGGITCDGRSGVYLCGGDGTGDTLSIMGNVTLTANGSPILNLTDLTRITGQWDNCTSTTTLFKADAIDGNGACAEAVVPRANVNLADVEDDGRYLIITDVNNTNDAAAVTLTNVSATDVNLATGNDEVTFSGGTYTGTISGDEGDDDLTFTSHTLSVGAIDGGAGDDTITLDRAATIAFTSSVDCSGTTTKICGGANSAGGVDHLNINVNASISGITNNTLTPSDVSGFEQFTASHITLSGFSNLTLKDSRLTTITGDTNANDYSLMGDISLVNSLSLGGAVDTLRLGVNAAGTSVASDFNIATPNSNCTDNAHVCGDAGDDALEIGSNISLPALFTAIEFATTKFFGGAITHHFTNSELGVVTFSAATELTLSGDNTLRYIEGSSGTDVVTILADTILRFTGAGTNCAAAAGTFRLCGGGGAGDTLSIAGNVEIYIQGSTTPIADLAALTNITQGWETCTSNTAAFVAGGVNASGACIAPPTGIVDVSLANAQDNTAYRDITGTNAADTKTLTNVTARNVNLLNEDDNLTINRGTYTGTIRGGNGNDTISFSGGSTTNIRAIDAGTGIDTVRVLTNTRLSYIDGSGGIGCGTDSTSGLAIVTRICGGSGTDHLVINNGARLRGSTFLDPSDIYGFERISAPEMTLRNFRTLTLTDSSLTGISGSTSADKYTLLGDIALGNSLSLGGGDDILRLGVNASGVSSATSNLTITTGSNCTSGVHFCAGAQGTAGDTLEFGNALTYSGNLTATGFEITKFYGGTHRFAGSTLGAVTFENRTTLNLSGVNNLQYIMGSDEDGDVVNILSGATLNFTGNGLNCGKFFAHVRLCGGGGDDDTLSIQGNVTLTVPDNGLGTTDPDSDPDVVSSIDNLRRITGQWESCTSTSTAFVANDADFSGACAEVSGTLLSAVVDGMTYSGISGTSGDDTKVLRGVTGAGLFLGEGNDKIYITDLVSGGVRTTSNYEQINTGSGADEIYIGIDLSSLDVETTLNFTDSRDCYGNNTDGNQRICFTFNDYAYAPDVAGTLHIGRDVSVTTGTTEGISFANGQARLYGGTVTLHDVYNAHNLAFATNAPHKLALTGLINVLGFIGAKKDDSSGVPVAGNYGKHGGGDDVLGFGVNAAFLDGDTGASTAVSAEITMYTYGQNTESRHRACVQGDSRNVYICGGDGTNRLVIGSNVSFDNIDLDQFGRATTLEDQPITVAGFNTVDLYGVESSTHGSIHRFVDSNMEAINLHSLSAGTQTDITFVLLGQSSFSSILGGDGNDVVRIGLDEDGNAFPTAIKFNDEGRTDCDAAAGIQRICGGLGDDTLIISGGATFTRISQRGFRQFTVNVNATELAGYTYGFENCGGNANADTNGVCATNAALLGTSAILGTKDADRPFKLYGRNAASLDAGSGNDAIYVGGTSIINYLSADQASGATADGGTAGDDLVHLGINHYGENITTALTFANGDTNYCDGSAARICGGGGNDRLVINGEASIYGSTNFNPVGNTLVTGFEMIELRQFSPTGNTTLALTGLTELALISGRTKAGGEPTETVYCEIGGTGTCLTTRPTQNLDDYREQVISRAPITYTNRQDIDLGNGGTITGATGVQRVKLVGVNLASVSTGAGNDMILIAGNSTINGTGASVIDAGNNSDVVILGGTYGDVYNEDALPGLIINFAGVYPAQVDGSHGTRLGTRIDFAASATIEGGSGNDVLVFRNNPAINRSGYNGSDLSGFPATNFETLIIDQDGFNGIDLDTSTGFLSTITTVALIDSTINGAITDNAGNDTFYLAGTTRLHHLQLNAGTNNVYIGARLNPDGTSSGRDTSLYFSGTGCGTGNAFRICAANGGSNTLTVGSRILKIYIDGVQESSDIAPITETGITTRGQAFSAPPPNLEVNAPTPPPDLNPRHGYAAGFENLIFEFDLQLENALIPAMQSITRDLALSAMRQKGVYSGERTLEGQQLATMKSFLAPELTAEAGYERDINIAEHGVSNSLWQSERGSQSLKAGGGVHRLSGELSAGEEVYEITGQASGLYLAYEAYALDMQIYALGAWFDIIDTNGGSKDHRKAIAEGSQLLVGGRVAYEVELGGITLTPNASIFWQDTEMDVNYAYAGREETTGMVALDAAWNSGALKAGLAYDGDYAGYEGGTQHFNAEPAAVVGFSQTLPSLGAMQFRAEANWRRGLDTGRETGSVRLSGALAF